MLYHYIITDSPSRGNNDCIQTRLAILDLKDLEGRDGRKCVLTCVDLWYPYHLLCGQKNI